MRIPTLIVATFLLPGVSRAMAADVRRLAVHEWGTLTSLQDETGRTIAGINSDDEPIPAFCHNIRADLIGDKGVTRSHPDVTMRLETPVMYFHPPTRAPDPMSIDVSVEFHGGWLTQFFPNAKADAPGLNPQGSNSTLPGTIKTSTVGILDWDNLKVGSGPAGPATDEHVWVTPRKVNAATVTVTEPDGKSESEKFLFYRGVGHLDAPVVANRQDGRIYFQCHFSDPLTEERIDTLWLVDIRPDGACAFQQLDPLPPQNKLGDLPSVPDTFPADRYSPDNFKSLRETMKKSLVSAGLYEDEAEAMLATWELSYFQSPGMRVFYIVPPHWTDRYLPLRLSVPADVNRVMVGRLELVTPRHRELLKQISTVTKPEDEQMKAYQDLGRFRNAFVLDELKQRPTPGLELFVSTHELRPFGWVEPATQPATQPRPVTRRKAAH